MARVVVTRRIFEAGLQRLEEAGHEVRPNQGDRPWPPERLRREVADAEALVCLLGDVVDAALLDAGPGLRIVANVAVGHDNIDVAAAARRGVVVTNTPDILTETTADLAFALLLAVARRLPEAESVLRQGRFDGWKLVSPWLGADVHGKTLGIYGMGRIGGAVARRAALGFGMRVIYHSRSRRRDLEAQLGARPVPFPQLLRESDYLSLHAPLSPETRHRFTARELRRMKRSAFLINTSRGGLVREEDLAAALEEGTIRGAGLDVFEGEPRVHPRLLALRENVVLLPHLGSATEETRRRMAVTAAENVVAVLEGRGPLHPVSPPEAGE